VNLDTILNSPVTAVCIGVLMGLVPTALYYREKIIRQARTRYFHCKECGREHALSYDGSWHALRSVEEIEADKRRAAERETMTPLGVPEKPKVVEKGIPLCTHGIPMDRPCNLCKIQHIDPSDHNPRRG
jgi:hypothetical protein